MAWLLYVDARNKDYVRLGAYQSILSFGGTTFHFLGTGYKVSIVVADGAKFTQVYVTFDSLLACRRGAARDSLTFREAAS